MDDSREYLCPECKKGSLIFRDYCKRHVKYDGGDKEWILIPRHKCDNPACKKLHRMIPDMLLPYKHYAESVICDTIDDRIDPSVSDDRPSVMTAIRWKKWINELADDINGHLKSIAHRELGYSEELLKSVSNVLASS